MSENKELMDSLLPMELDGVNIGVRLLVKPYKEDGTMGVIAMRESREPDGAPEQLFIVTADLFNSETLAINEQYVDVASHPGIGRWLEETGVAVPTDRRYVLSDGTVYPVYVFDLPQRYVEPLRETREDAVAERLIGRIALAGRKPVAENECGAMYEFDGYRVVTYNGKDPERYGDKPDVFVTGRFGGELRKRRWRLRDVPGKNRAMVMDAIEKAVQARQKKEKSQNDKTNE